MMKKLFLLTLLVAGVMMGVEAQNRSIDFEQTKEWKKVLKKAKGEEADFCGLLHFLVRSL